MAQVPNKGEQFDASYNDGQVRGDTKAFGSFSYPQNFGGTMEGKDIGQDATNRIGSVSGTDSDSMFARTKSDADNQMTGSDSPDSVSSQAMAGTGSDPKEEDLAYEQQMGAGAAPAESAADMVEDKKEKF